MTITETEAKWHVDAGTRMASKAWQAVALAAGEDDRPSLDRTMLVEIYPGGVRLVATDTYILLWAWVPGFDPKPAPLDDEPPFCVNVFDECGVAGALMTHLTHNWADRQVISFDADSSGLLITVQGSVSLRLPASSSPFPRWRTAIEKQTVEPTDRLQMTEAILPVLGELSQIGGHVKVTAAGGEMGSLSVLVESDPPVHGLVMPARWT